MSMTIDLAAAHLPVLIKTDALAVMTVRAGLVVALRGPEMAGGGPAREAIERFVAILDGALVQTGFLTPDGLASLRASEREVATHGA